MPSVIRLSSFVVTAAAIASPGRAMAQIVVSGTGDPTVDVPAVQAAVNLGGDVILQGHFSFDSPPAIVPEIPGAPLATVRVATGVTISGIVDEDGQMTTIEGGQVPFEVEALDSSVTVQRLHFLRPQLGAIDVSAVSGLTVASCWIESLQPVASSPLNYGISVNTSYNPPTPSAPGAPERVSGNLSIVDNEIDLGGGTGAVNTIGILIFSAGVAGAEIEAHILRNRISNNTMPDARVDRAARALRISRAAASLPLLRGCSTRCQRVRCVLTVPRGATAGYSSQGPIRYRNGSGSDRLGSGMEREERCGTPG
jgi:hypothetical protein